MAHFEIIIPDIGNFAEVEVIEVLVKAGDRIRPFQSLITVECDKATLEIPSDHSGVVKELKVKLGDKVSKGSVILTMHTGDTLATLPTAEMQQRVADSNNHVRKLWVIGFSATSIIWMWPLIAGKISFLDFLLSVIFHILVLGVFVSGIYLRYMIDKCPKCGVFEYDAKNKKIFKEIGMEVVEESERWVWGTRHDAIRDVSGRVTGYVDRRERKRQIQQIVDHVYHCKFCDSTWRIRRDYQDG